MARRTQRTAKTAAAPGRDRGGRDPGALVVQGLAAFQAGRAEEALTLAEQALEVSAGHAHALLLGGVACIRLGRAEQAQALLSEKVRLEPHSVEGHVNLGAALQMAGRLGDAIAAYRHALDLDPVNVDALVNLGLAHRDSGDFTAAEAAFRAALVHAPNDPRLNRLLGFVARWLGRPDEAARLYDRAVALAPDDAELRFTRGLHRLCLGRFKAGWRDLECRWHYPKSGSIARPFAQPSWRGESLAGKTIVVWGEQGIGDQILHAPQLARLATAGARVVLETDPRLVALFGRSLDGIEVVGSSDPPHPITNAAAYQVALASLPLHLPEWPAGVYPVGRWLAPDPARRAGIAHRLAAVARGRPTLGLSWRSQVEGLGPVKSTPLDAWRPILAGHDVLFVALQYGDIAAEVAAEQAASGADIYIDPEIDRFNDLDGLAALVDAVDAVITTSNVTAHFAGALGKTTLLALHHVPFWYWLPAFEAYRSVERYTQDAAQDWTSVVMRIGKRLGELLER